MRSRAMTIGILNLVMLGTACAADGADLPSVAGASSSTEYRLGAGDRIKIYGDILAYADFFFMADDQFTYDEKDFARADSIRQELARKGVIIEDGADGTRWKVAKSD